MLDKLWVSLTNTLYGTSHRARSFQDKHTGTKIVIACATKGRKLKEDKNPQYDYRWALARRDTLILADTGLYCGDWEILLNNIREAKLFKIASGAVIKVLTIDGWSYQFGIQTNPEWETQTILPLKVEKQGVQSSAIFLTLRLLMIVFFAYLAIQDFSQNGFSITTFLLVLLLIYYLARPLIH
jgi:hypothetical protein